MAAPSFAEVVDILHEIAPLELAAERDNVGVLLQPKVRPGRVQRVLLTIDLTPAVAAEAAKLRTDLIVAYHPPLYRPMQRLQADGGVQEGLLRAAAAGIAVYSPHTALDAAPSGLADWLAERMLGGEAPKELRPCGEGEFGRVVELTRPLPFAQLLQRCRRTFGVRALTIAAPTGRAPRSVRSIAVAAGAGASILRGSRAEVWITGELSHHDALAAIGQGVTVVLAGHSATERPYLKVLQRRLRSAFGRDLDVRIARADRDPFMTA